MADLIPSRPVVKRSSCLWAWLRGAGFCFQMMLAVSLIFFGVRAYVVRTRLQAILANMDRTDPGWRLSDIEAARAVVPDAENSALRVIAANKLLPQPPKSWIEDDFDMELQRLPPETPLSPAQFIHLRQRLDEVKSALDELQGMGELPNGRFPLVFNRNPWKTTLPDHQGCRNIFHLLHRNSLACAEAGEPHLAAESCRGALNAARAVGDEPLAIVQLIRVAGVTNTCRMAERLLAQTEPELADLRRLQEQFETEDTFSYWSLTWRGERAFDSDGLEALEAGVMTPSEILEPKPSWWETVFAFAIQDNVRAVHPQLFVYAERVKAAASLPAKRRGPAMQQIDREIRRAGINFATLWITVYPKLLDAFLRCHTALRCQAAALAVERYRRLHGGWPESLEQLTPDLLAEVPTDPFSDDPLLYRRFPDGIMIYSVGSDGEDNGGNIDWDHPNMPKTDIGFRLWDVAKRRQPPKPDEPAKQP
jgi:hypothetical protein